MSEFMHLPKISGDPLTQRFDQASQQDCDTLNILLQGTVGSVYGGIYDAATGDYLGSLTVDKNTHEWILHLW